MDITILFQAFASFFLYLGLLIVLFRLTRRENAMRWMIRAWLGVALLMCIIVIGTWRWEEILFSVSIFSSLVLLFVFGVFSIMEASLTIRIFSEIASVQEGITIQRLLKKYNRKIIIKKRIARLLHSGELKKSRDGYVLGRLSYFRIREYFLNMFRLAFR